MPLQGSLSIERMCQLAGVSRAGFYRSLQDRAPIEEDMEVRSVIQQIAVEHRRRYGYRRISAELRRRGMLVNHKRVLRIIREDNLLAVQPRAFVVTTDSDHEFEIYLNLNVTPPNCFVALDKSPSRRDSGRWAHDQHIDFWFRGATGTSF